MNQVSAIGKDHFLQLSVAGSQLNLSFSGYEVFNNMIMALDGINRKLLLMPCSDSNAEFIIIPLDEHVNITLKKIYSDIPAGGLKSKSLEAFLEKVQLEFEIPGRQQNIVVPVYDGTINPFEHRSTLVKKARGWQQLLLKLSGRSSTKSLNKVVVLSANNNNIKNQIHQSTSTK